MRTLCFKIFAKLDVFVTMSQIGAALEIRSFSQMHKSHFRDPQTYFYNFIAMYQLIKSLISFSFSFRKYLDNSMFFSRDLFLKEQ